MSWKVSCEPQAEKDLKFWIKKDRKKYEKCKRLIGELSKDPRTGSGKPERLKHFGNQDIWSRRIDSKNRIMYIIYEEIRAQIST